MIKIVNMEGPHLDPTSFIPYLRITADFKLEVTQEGRTPEENAMIIYQAWTQAIDEWNSKNVPDAVRENV